MENINSIYNMIQPTGCKKQINDIWKMLDELQKKDPEQYKKYINQQLNEGKKFMSLPKPYAYTLSKIRDKTGRKKYLYLNICSWEKIPYSQGNTNDPIRIIHGILYKSGDDDEKYLTTNVALNPKVLIENGCENYQKTISNNNKFSSLFRIISDYMKQENQIDIYNSESSTICRHKYHGDWSEISNDIASSNNLNSQKSKNVEKFDIKSIINKQNAIIDEPKILLPNEIDEKKKEKKTNKKEEFDMESIRKEMWGDKQHMHKKEKKTETETEKKTNSSEIVLKKQCKIKNKSDTINCLKSVDIEQDHNDIMVNIELNEGFDKKIQFRYENFLQEISIHNFKEGMKYSAKYYESQNVLKIKCYI
ncbi:hypothetical protein A3Q56_00378 [Intoshia linei]|uniref:PIH1 N-terminal domain-containing protein n=1 Tax=Intoshia linei TaxID=1819745 RepID=A0A177BCB2_9BILA|nr:hypothetical protein A3Q56_00378 [Intoshia linei]